MRRARTRRRTAAVALVAMVAAVPLLGGCGIQETDVIEAGGPASFQAFLDRDNDMLVFLRSPDGAVVPVIRQVNTFDVFEGRYVEAGSAGENSAATQGQAPTEKVVAVLLAGPDKEDRAAGLDTALPAARSGEAIEVEPFEGGVRARVPFALGDLDSTALRQLTCTIAYSQDADGQITVDLTGQDGTTRSDTCGLAVGVTTG